MNSFGSCFGGEPSDRIKSRPSEDRAAPAEKGRVEPVFGGLNDVIEHGLLVPTLPA
jgi:hypothetical protein